MSENWSIFQKNDAKTNEEVDKFLESMKVGSGRGRLIFALDGTASRQKTWDFAAGLQAEMLREAASVGSLDLQLIYYRGDGECRSSKWISDPAQLARVMSAIDCRAGYTQIGKILDHAQKETALAPVGALVFIGDAVEENPDILVTRARGLGRLKVPVFMFQEGRDPEVETVFRAIAKNSGGAYGRFDAGAVKQLGEFLRAVAIFAAGGLKALEGRKDAGSVLLLGQLKKGG